MEGLHVVDFSQSGSADKRSQLAKEIVEIARSEVLALTDYDISAKLLLRRGRRVFQTFFESPEPFKRTAYSEGRGLGYIPMGAESLAASKGTARPADLKESFNAGRDDSRNLWPNEFEELKRVTQELYARLDQLALDLLRLIALGLGESEYVFDEAVVGGMSVIRASYYPPLESTPPSGALRAGSHTDYGTISLLLPDPKVGGFEVLIRGEWTEVSAPVGALVVNIGDLLERWTNGILPATLHRVQLPDVAGMTQGRLSLVFLHNPLPHAIISPLSSCVERLGGSKYDPVEARSYLKARSRASRRAVR